LIKYEAGYNENGGDIKGIYILTFLDDSNAFWNCWIAVSRLPRFM